MAVLPVPSYSQHKYGAGTATNRWNNCGPTTLCDVHEYLRGKWLNPDAIHDAIVGDRASGYLYVNQLYEWLRGRSYTCYCRYGQSKAAYLESIRQALAKGWPVIVLQYFDRNNSRGGHWCVVRGIEGNRVYLCNPWDTDARYGHLALLEWVSLDTFLRISADRYYIVIQEAPNLVGGYKVYPERWRADVAAGDWEWVNVRSAPSTEALVVRRVYPGHNLLFTKYTDEGGEVRGSSRWLYSEWAKGWIANGCLTNWKQV